MAHEGMVKNRRTGSKVLTLIMVLIIIALLATGGFFFKQYRDIRKQRSTLQAQNADLNKQLSAYKTDPQKAGQAEADKIIAEVGKLYDLPKEETPIVGKVNDVATLPKDQPFFTKAVKDDVTLIYSKAKLAVLYRPSTKQIINVSSVTIQDKPAATSTTP